MTSAGFSFDIALPVLNEEGRLRRGVEETIDFCAKNGIDARVTVADNGSTDATAQVASELMGRYKNVELVQVGRRGVGRALKKAWGRSDCMVVGYMDVDLPTDLKHLTEVVSILKGEDGDAVVTGSRLLKGSTVVNRALAREASSRIFNWLLRAALGVKFSDGMCGFKFLRKSTFEKLMASGVRSNEWFFNTEILVKAEWLGLKIIEIPVRWVDDRNSRVRLFETTFQYIREIIRLRKERTAIFSR